MEISQKPTFVMICDMHFGDMRNDLTPAKRKWLPNNYPEAPNTLAHNLKI